MLYIHCSGVVPYRFTETFWVHYYLLHRICPFGFWLCKKTLVVREAAILGEPFAVKYNEDWLIPVSRTDSEWEWHHQRAELTPRETYWTGNKALEKAKEDFLCFASQLFQDAAFQQIPVSPKNTPNLNKIFKMCHNTFLKGLDIHMYLCLTNILQIDCVGLLIMCK